MDFYEYKFHISRNDQPAQVLRDVFGFQISKYWLTLPKVLLVGVVDNIARNRIEVLVPTQDGLGARRERVRVFRGEADPVVVGTTARVEEGVVAQLVLWNLGQRVDQVPRHFSGSQSCFGSLNIYETENFRVPLVSSKNFCFVFESNLASTFNS